MKIVSEDQASHVILEVTTFDAEPQYPSFRLFVSVTDEGFSGAYREVWISLDDYEKFLADLHVCEETRRGKATLSSISPDEMEIIIEQCDGWGHFLLRYSLSKTSYASSIAVKKMVSGGFNLDSSKLGEIVAEFAALTEARPA